MANGSKENYTFIILFLQQKPLNRMIWLLQMFTYSFASIIFICHPGFSQLHLIAFSLCLFSILSFLLYHVLLLLMHICVARALSIRFTVRLCIYVCILCFISSSASAVLFCLPPFFSLSLSVFFVWNHRTWCASMCNAHNDRFAN